MKWYLQFFPPNFLIICFPQCVYAPSMQLYDMIGEMNFNLKFLRRNPFGKKIFILTKRSLPNYAFKIWSLSVARVKI